jgi:hypothetical protein
MQGCSPPTRNALSRSVANDFDVRRFQDCKFLLVLDQEREVWVRGQVPSATEDLAGENECFIEDDGCTVPHLHKGN